MTYRSKTKRGCVVCGKIFYPSRKEYLTCSIKCGCQRRKGKSAIAKRHKLKCEYCGKEVTKKDSRIKKYKRHYCSRECYWKHKKFTQIGKDNSNYKDGPKNYKCQYCGKEYESYQEDRIYCSKICMDKGLSKRRGSVQGMKKGFRYEWDVMKKYKEHGFIVVRSAGSHSPFDLIAINPKLIVLIQCKREKKISSKTRKEIERFGEIRVPENCRKEFRIKEDYKDEQIIADGIGRPIGLKD